MTTEQLVLGRDDLGTPTGRLEQRFAEFHREHPDVYERLVALARDAKERGWDKCGIGFLWERLRWELGPHHFEERGYRLNNVLRPYYARAIMDGEPDLRGFFETRALSSERLDIAPESFG